MFAVQPGVSERLEGGAGKVVYTSPEGLRRNLAQFGFQLFKLRLDLSKIRHKERHPPFNQPVQTGPSQGRTKAVNSCGVLGGGGLVRRAIHA